MNHYIPNYLSLPYSNSQRYSPSSSDYQRYSPTQSNYYSNYPSELSNNFNQNNNLVNSMLNTRISKLNYEKDVLNEFRNRNPYSPPSPYTYNPSFVTLVSDFNQLTFEEDYEPEIFFKTRYFYPNYSINDGVSIDTNGSYYTNISLFDSKNGKAFKKMYLNTHLRMATKYSYEYVEPFALCLNLTSCST